MSTSGGIEPPNTVLTGAGPPNGSVVAPVGSVYCDTSATTGAVEWVKASGTGNTGWQVAYGNTGARDMSSLFINGWTGSASLQRVNNIIEAVFFTNNTTSTSALPFVFPAGFTPAVTQNYLVTASPTGGTLLVNTDGTGSLGTATTAIRAACTFIAAATWPTVLPGAAG